MGGRIRWLTAGASRVTGRLARIRVPRPLRPAVLGGAARLLGMDLSEAELPVSEYPTLDALFVRRLRSGARRWPPDGGPGSPVDGVVGSSGRIEAGRLLQAKGRDYTVADLLDDDAAAARFQGGTFVTLYLAPRHYHRIHAPIGGVVPWARHIPGRLLPVNAPAVRAVDRLFPRNERLVAFLEPEARPAEGGGVGAVGAAAVVAVGAFNVGRITADFDPGLVTNRRGARPETRRYPDPLPVARGDPLMAFHLGSTVVLLFERPVSLAVAPGSEIRLGEALVG